MKEIDYQSKDDFSDKRWNMENNQDRLVRATAANDQLRCFAVTTTGIVEHVRSVHGYSPIATAAIGRLMTGGVMMGSMLRNSSDVITLQIKGDGPLSYLVVTSRNDGSVRGCVNGKDTSIILPPNKDGHLNVGSAIGKGTLTVIEDLGMREPYTTEIDLHSSEIADDLTYFFAQSEQTPTSVGLGVLFDKDSVTVKRAGGYIIQLLPNTEEKVISKLEENINRLHGVTDILKEKNTPEDILKTVLDGFDISFKESMPVFFHCDCSKEKGRHILKLSGRKELHDIIEENKPVEIVCNFCGKKYEYSIDEVKDILKELIPEKK